MAPRLGQDTQTGKLSTEQMKKACRLFCVDLAPLIALLLPGRMRGGLVHHGQQ